MSTSNKLTVVKAEPPAVRTIKFRDFDLLVTEIDKLAKNADTLSTACSMLTDAVYTNGNQACAQLGVAEKLLENAQEKWSTLEKRLAKCRADFVHHHHRSMFDDDWNLKNPGIIAEKVADMLGAFPNLGPHNPEDYVPRMINEIAHSGHFPGIIEGAMRKIVRTSKFPPSVAEMLKAMEDEASIWATRWPVIDTVEDNEEGDALDYWFKELAETITWAKTELDGKGDA